MALGPGMRRALDTVCASLDGLDSPWAVTGSVGLALLGLDVVPRDLDLETDAAGAVTIAARLGAFVVQPVRFVGDERVRSHYGMFEIEAIAVEIMGEMWIRDAAGRWQPPADLHAEVQWIEFGAHRVPVVGVAAQLRMYERLGRVERVVLLRGHAS